MQGHGRNRTGALIVVVGPSGAGKDSVIAFAVRHLAGHEKPGVVRRVITRPRDAGGEDHEPSTAEAFEARHAAGGFAVAWTAHGLKYGIPSEALERVRAGEILIANGSRAALGQFRQAFGAITVVNITASADVLARRLMSRGRESEAEILKRLQRQAPDLLDEPGVVTIDNSDPIEVAGRRLAALIVELRAAAGPATRSA